MLKKIVNALNAIGKDKYIHYTVSLLVGMFTFAICKVFGLGVYSAIPAIALPMILGIGKECYDKKTTGLFDHNDIVADFLGVFTAAVLISLLLIL